MKRRNTRKNIHKSEKWLAEQVHSYITSISNEDTFAKNQSGLQICWGLTWLLSNYLNLDPLWLKKKRWLDGIINAHISLENFDTITVYGKMVWGLSEDPGGNQWIEPFESVIRVSRNKSRIAAYTLKFGDIRNYPQN